MVKRKKKSITTIKKNGGSILFGLETVKEFLYMEWNMLYGCPQSEEPRTKHACWRTETGIAYWS
jgi:hypothetical protein